MACVDGEVVGEDHADAFGDGLDFVEDICVPCRPRKVKVGSREVECLSAMAQLELTSLVGGGQGHDEGAKHAGDLFRVLVGLEEGALLVKQQPSWRRVGVDASGRDSVKEGTIGARDDHIDSVRLAVGTWMVSLVYLQYKHCRFGSALLFYDLANIARL